MVEINRRNAGELKRAHKEHLSVIVAARVEILYHSSTCDPRDMTCHSYVLPMDTCLASVMTVADLTVLLGGFLSQQGVSGPLIRETLSSKK